LFVVVRRSSFVVGRWSFAVRNSPFATGLVPKQSVTSLMDSGPMNWSGTPPDFIPIILVEAFRRAQDYFLFPTVPL